jgi:Glycosyl transferases group 1
MTGNKKIFSTLRYPDVPEWMNSVEVLDRRSFSLVGMVRRIRTAASRYPVLVLDGTGRADQVAATIIARMRRPPRVIMTDATWKRGSTWPDRLGGAIGMRAMRGPHITFCVLSGWELERFAQTWKVDPAQVRYTPFCFTLPEAELNMPVAEDGGVFAGGDSLRDYRPLLEAAADIEAPVTIASLKLGRSSEVSPNLKVGKVSRERFAELNRRAAVVVVALAASDDRSAGQQTYLNAMALGKPVVVTDAPGVRDYIDDRETGLIVPLGDAAAMASAINWLLDPANKSEVERICRLARETVRSRFARRDYVASIMSVAEERLTPPGPSHSMPVDGSTAETTRG